jgi:hypothetical protein
MKWTDEELVNAFRNQTKQEVSQRSVQRWKAQLAKNFQWDGKSLQRKSDLRTFRDAIEQKAAEFIMAIRRYILPSIISLN